MRKLLREDHRHIFTLIHKFQLKRDTDQSGNSVSEKRFPKLSDRDDIIVICDEAHRTQYGQLAANIRDALPNATFVAFTATPLFVEDEKTRQIFGDYVSIYNFKQSVEDGATVPLYYIKGPPEVEVINKGLNAQIEALVEEANLDEDQIEKLRRKYPSEFNIITNDSRLELVAKHIVDHYMGRGYRGKAMVVSVDRFTAVKMYEKVQFYWNQRIQELEAKLARTSDYEKQIIQQDIKYMKETDMAVVISNSQNEIKKFKEKGLDIRPHRKRIISEDLDVKFKDEDNPLRIVFVCAMWMTGFDVPPVSTIFLDKPIRNHTLMQTISRANRVFKDKQSGTIVDYYGILRNLKEALAIYGSGSGGGLVEGDFPLRNIDDLEQNVKSNLDIMKRYFTD